MCSVSDFQFTRPKLVHLEFNLNGKFEGSMPKLIPTVQVTIQKNELDAKAIVSLELEIGEKSNVYPFYVHAVESANFRWGDEFDNDIIEHLLHRNAPSLLLSYLRPIIAQVTSSSLCGSYDIPFMNFTKKINRGD